MAKSEDELIREIRKIKKEKGITLLAHYYQRPEVQDIADYVGDSLGLSQQARDCKAEKIVFAGVHFMAQTAKIINPASKVILPDLDAGCSLSDSCPPEQFRAFKEAHPDHVVVSYINCSAEIKAMSDIICTSANAEKVVRSIPAGKPILFAPDKNLGQYLIHKIGRDMLLWDGACLVHEAFAVDKLIKLHLQYPEAKIVVHPESPAHLLKVANYIGSTTGMIKYVKESQSRQFIVATEVGILHAMIKETSGKELIPAPIAENNTCACSECSFMKLNTLDKIFHCMIHEHPEVNVEESLRVQALAPLLRMLEISQN